jgi:translation initiation factor IF-2
MGEIHLQYLINIAGEAEVLQVFDFKFKDGKRNVAGCRCVQGNLQRKLTYKVIRDEEEVFRGIAAYISHVSTLPWGDKAFVLSLHLSSVCPSICH